MLHLTFCPRTLLQLGPLILRPDADGIADGRELSPVPVPQGGGTGEPSGCKVVICTTLPSAHDARSTCPVGRAQAALAEVSRAKNPESEYVADVASRVSSTAQGLQGLVLREVREPHPDGTGVDVPRRASGPLRAVRMQSEALPHLTFRPRTLLQLDALGLRFDAPKAPEGAGGPECRPDAK